MKTKNAILVSASVMAIIAASAGCSTISGNESGKDLASNGPTVLNPRSVPDKIEMNQSLQPKQNVEVFADVKDFNSKVSDVKLQFTNIPLEIPMKNITGSTWRAELTAKQLQMLAVSGKTIDYQATVVAKDANGIIAQSTKPVTLAIKAPELAKATG